MTYDAQVPVLLKSTQQWFASIITRPIDDNSQIDPIAPSGTPIEQEAARYIVRSPTLLPHQRIQLYSQQYWWRLLHTLQDLYPLVVRLFGYYEFNQKIAVPYLLKYPSNGWSLSFLGDRLPQWVREEYHEEDKQLVQDAIDLDCAFNCSFIAAQNPPIDNAVAKEQDLADLLPKTLYLQPHIHLFKLDYNLFATRSEFLKEDPEYWMENDFPELVEDKTYTFILYRDNDNNIAWNSIDYCEFALLNLFEKGKSVEDACEWLEEQNETLYEEAIENLQEWFQKWMMLRWLSLKER